MKLYWTGSDALYLVSYPPGIRFRFKCKIHIFRWVMRITEPFIEWHLVENDLTREHLQKFGFKKNIEVIPVVPKHDKKMKKKKHEGFNILYYMPKDKKNMDFIKWLYGYDIYLKLKEYLGDRVNWIIVDGSADMTEIYPITDFYLRPTRNNGYSRIRKECEIQDIPLYYSKTNPSFHIAKFCIEDAMQ